MGLEILKLGVWHFCWPTGAPSACCPSFASRGQESGCTFIWSRQVGTAMRLMLSEEVLMSTLQSRSTRRGRETVWGQLGSVRTPPA